MQNVEPRPGPRAEGPVVPYRHLAGWTIATSVVLGAVAFMLALLTESVIADARNQSDVRDQIFVARSDLAAVHTRWVTLTRGAVLFLVVAAVLWLVCQYQAHANLRALGTSRIPPWLAIAMWLIPGLNVLLAWVGLGDLWLGSEPGQRDAKAGPRAFPPILALWWGSFSAAVVLTAVALLRTPSGARADDLIPRDRLLVAACLTGIAAAILGIMLLVKIEGRIDVKEDAAGHPSWRAWSDGRPEPGTPLPPRETRDMA